MSTAIRTIQMPGARAAAAEVRTSGDYLARAVALHLAGKRQEALDHLDRAVAGNQGSPEIYRAMGHILFEMGDCAAAAKTYRLLVQAKPQYALGWLNLAVCLERINDWEARLAVLLQGFHARPQKRRSPSRSGCLPPSPGRRQVRPLFIRPLPGAFPRP